VSVTPAPPSSRWAAVVDGVLAGHPRALARALTAIENDAPGVDELLGALAPRAGRARVVGVTGPPGAGKSTLIDALVGEWRARGRTVGVLAVDPSSPVTGGAILGDRVRMGRHAGDPGVFVRSLASRGHLGGLVRAARGIVLAMDAYGPDVLVLETVGAGQSEVEVARYAPVKLVLCPPGLGDDVQAMKAGVLEIADVLVVNKADDPRAADTASQLEAMLALRASSAPPVRVLRTIATTGQGVPALVDALDAAWGGTNGAHGEASGGAWNGGPGEALDHAHRNSRDPAELHGTRTGPPGRRPGPESTHGATRMQPPPPILDDAQLLVPDVLDVHGTNLGDKEAVICGDVRRTWRDFAANVNRVANALGSIGVGRGHKVAVLMGNSVQMLETLFGVVKAGACAVPLSGLLTGEQLCDLIDDSGATALFASAEFRAKIVPCAQRLRTVPSERRFASLTPEPGWPSAEALFARAPATRPAVRCEPADEFNIIYSSGTTGLPKGIVQTHRARTHWAVSNAIEMGITSATRGLATTSLYSNGTWLVMLPTLFAGGTLVVMPAFDTAGFLETIERERITHTFVVPTQLVMVLLEKTLGARDTSSLRVMLSAGSPLRRDTKEQVIERFGPKVYELYGFSEGFGSMLKPADHPRKPDSVGVPVIGFEARIVDDDGNVLPPGQPGEIAGYGAGMMKGYHNRPDATAELIWRDALGRTFIRSGDIGVIDEDGFLRIVDRKKDMIISGGFNVFATDIEQVVARHPAVLDVAVIATPHEKWGETPLAVVTPRPGAQPGADEIAQWANAQLGAHQRISRVEFLDEFPRNALGKVLKRLLREKYSSGA